MPGVITRFLSADHARLDGLLARALRAGGEIDLEAFAGFREGLLRHIALEEKILLPALARARAGEPLPDARRLRVDHGAIAALLVPTPTASLVGELRKILTPHNDIEEGERGVYATADVLLAASADELVERMRAYPPVKVARYHDGPRVCRTAEDALRLSALQAARS